MRDYDAVFKACEGVDCVFHVAACGMSGLEQASTVLPNVSCCYFCESRALTIGNKEQIYMIAMSDRS